MIVRRATTSSNRASESAANRPATQDADAGRRDKLRVLSLFAGIGGFDLGLERTGGFETVAFCEIDPFCRRVLAKHWPHVRQYEDVRELTAKRLAADGIAVDVICGGFPCQDLSVAGKQTGIEGARSGLWSEICRLARETRPQFIIVENVANLLAGERGSWFSRVLRDLAALGHDAEWHCIPASYVGAPHRRDRVWIVSYSKEADVAGDLLGPGDLWRASAQHRGFCRDLGESGTGQWEVEPLPRMVRVADGLPKGLDCRLGALGNAVVPQIPEIIGRAILAARASEIPAASAVAPVGALAGGHCAEMGGSSLATGGPVVSSSGRAAHFRRDA